MDNIKGQLLELNKISKRGVAIYHRFAVSNGISDSALGVLYALLVSDAPCSQYDLCSEWSIPKQTINTAVASLQDKDFITLTPIGGTRNKKNIALTEKGKGVAESVIGVLYDTELKALGQLSPEEREIYIRLNNKYNKCLADKLQSIMTETS